MNLLDLWFPPKPPEVIKPDIEHIFMGNQIPPVNPNKLTHGEYAQREKARKKRWSEKRTKRRAELRAKG